MKGEKEEGEMDEMMNTTTDGEGIGTERRTDERTDRRTDRRTDVRTYVHTYVRSHVHTYLRTYVCTYPPHVPRPKYGFSLDRSAVLEGEEKSKLTCVTPSCVQKNAKMQV